MDETVFADVISAFGDLLPQRFAHTSPHGMPRLGKHAATNASRLIQPLPFLSTAELLGNPYAGPETHQSTGVDRHLLFSVRTVPSMF